MRFALLALVAVVVGCGSDAGGERAAVPLREYVSDASEICGRAGKVYEEAGGIEDLRGPQGLVLRRIARGYDTMADGFERLHRELVALPDPDRKRDLAREFERALGAFAAFHREASEQAAAGDIEDLTATLNSEISLKKPMVAASDALGVDC